MKAYIIKKIERLRKERRIPPSEPLRPSVPVPNQSVPVPNSHGTIPSARTPHQRGSRVVIVDL